jgi:hypothetical protein
MQGEKGEKMETQLVEKKADKLFAELLRAIRADKYSNEDIALWANRSGDWTNTTYQGGSWCVSPECTDILVCVVHSLDRDELRKKILFKNFLDVKFDIAKEVYDEIFDEIKKILSPEPAQEMCMKNSAECRDESCPNWNHDLDCCEFHKKIRIEAITLGEVKATKHKQEAGV